MISNYGGDFIFKISVIGAGGYVFPPVSSDPLTSAQCTLPEIREMVDRMLEAESQWLSEFTSKTFITD
ncbi:MAG: hypothetical protein ACOCQ5_04250 [Halanaerobiales bacterium]